MDNKSILAAIASIEELLASSKEQLAVLKSLVNTAEESVIEVEVPQVSNEENTLTDGRELLPPPPAEIIIPSMLEEEGDDDSPTEEDLEDSKVGWTLLNKLSDFYSGQAKRVELQRGYWDNSDKVNPKTGKLNDKLFIDKNNVWIKVYNANNKLLGKIKKHNNYLLNLIPQRMWNIINDHRKSSDPHKNWMPKEVTLWLL